MTPEMFTDALITCILCVFMICLTVMASVVYKRDKK